MLDAFQHALQAAHAFLGGFQPDQQHDEFVAAEVGHRVVGAHCFLDAPRNLHQHPVSDRVTAAVDHRLEAVQVEMAYREQAPVAFGAGQCLRQAVGQQCAVGHAGQGVVMRDMFQLPFVLDAFGDVRRQADNPAHAAILVAQAEPDDIQQVGVAVDKVQPCLRMVRRRLAEAFQVRLPARRGGCRGQQVGVMGGGNKPAFGDAQGIAQAAADEAHAPLRVDHPDGQWGMVEDVWNLRWSSGTGSASLCLRTGKFRSMAGKPGVGYSWCGKIFGFIYDFPPGCA